MNRFWSMMLSIALLIGIVFHPIPVQAEDAAYYIKINRQQNCVTIYERDVNGKYTVPVRAFACSVGVNNATPRGCFKLGEKYRWHELDGKVYGQYCTRITGRVLFHSVYYHTTNPSTLYYNAYNRLGTAASHGCVRVCVADAKWIYDNCSEGTTVEIYDSSDPGPLGKPAAIKISTTSSNRGWDPTDPNPDNPWKLSGPEITGVKDLTVERGSSVSKLTADVKAVDFAGNAVSVTMTGSCNLDKLGRYKITYEAVDRLGNVSRQQAVVTVEDTKAPTIKRLTKKIKMTDESWNFENFEELKTFLKGCVEAKDNGEPLQEKYIHVSANKLWNAWMKSRYGKYEIQVYATDDAGNQSKVKTLIVKYRDSDRDPDIEESNTLQN